MSAIPRGLRILEHLAGCRVPQSHADLVAALDIPRSTLSDLLAQLRAGGYVELRDRRYALGPATRALAYEVTRRDDPAVALAPLLAALTDATGETSLLTIEVAGTGRMRVVDQVEGTNPLRFVARLGHEFPMINSPSGLAILAFTDRTDRDLPAAAVVGVPGALSGDALGRELRRIRRRGYAVSGREEGGQSSIAVPVPDPAGRPTVAVSVVGATSLIRRERAALAATLVAEVAAAERS